MDKEKEIAIIIKTFFRDEALYECINSIKQYCNDSSYRIYIADDGEIDQEKQRFYDRLEAEGHYILVLPFNTGASKSRNLLLDCIGQEKYILRMDDDFCFCPETRLADMKLILDRDDKVGAVADLEIQAGTGKGSFSGQVSSWQGYLDISGRKLYVRLIRLRKFNYKYIEGIQYAKCGFSRNMLLLRREMLEKVRWDENLKFEGEHIDFLLQINASGWELVFTTNSKHIHKEDIKFYSNFDKYKKVKKLNTGQEKEVFRNKWGIDEIVKQRSLADYAKAGFTKLIRGIRTGY